MEGVTTRSHGRSQTLADVIFREPNDIAAVPCRRYKGASSITTTSPFRNNTSKYLLVMDINKYLINNGVVSAQRPCY